MDTACCKQNDAAWTSKLIRKASSLMVLVTSAAVYIYQDVVILVVNHPVASWPPKQFLGCIEALPEPQRPVIKLVMCSWV